MPSDKTEIHNVFWGFLTQRELSSNCFRKTGILYLGTIERDKSNLFTLITDVFSSIRKF